MVYARAMVNRTRKDSHARLERVNAGCHESALLRHRHTRLPRHRSRHQLTSKTSVISAMFFGVFCHNLHAIGGNIMQERRQCSRRAPFDQLRILPQRAPELLPAVDYRFDRRFRLGSRRGWCERPSRCLANFGQLTKPCERATTCCASVSRHFEPSWVSLLVA
jgi:hypothetical protein